VSFLEADPLDAYVYEKTQHSSKRRLKNFVEGRTNILYVGFDVTDWTNEEVIGKSHFAIFNSRFENSISK